MACTSTGGFGGVRGRGSLGLAFDATMFRAKRHQRCAQERAPKHGTPASLDGDPEKTLNATIAFVTSEMMYRIDYRSARMYTPMVFATQSRSIAIPRTPQPNMPIPTIYPRCWVPSESNGCPKSGLGTSSFQGDYERQDYHRSGCALLPKRRRHHDGRVEESMTSLVFNTTVLSDVFSLRFRRGLCLPVCLMGKKTL